MLRATDAPPRRNAARTLRLLSPLGAGGMGEVWRWKDAHFLVMELVEGGCG
jgi:hypothetical protein